MYESWIIYVALALFALWLIFMPIAIILHLLYGIGLNVPGRLLNAPFLGMPSRGLAFIMGSIGLVIYSIIIGFLFDIFVLSGVIERAIGERNG